MILNFTNTNRFNINIIFILSFLFLRFCAYSNPEITYKLSQYKNKDYILNIYINDKIIYKEQFINEPSIEILDSGIFKISISAGNPLNYTYFYDTNLKKKSPIYENAFAIYNDKISYFEDEKLKISNIMNKKLFYKEIKRNWTKTAVPSNAIENVEFLSDYEIKIYYLKGKEYEEISELINLHDIK